MTSADRWGGAVRQQGPEFLNPANNFGETPATSFTYSAASGPYFPNGSGEPAPKPSRDAAFAPFFGIPSKEDVQDPYDAYDIENYQLPDGFKGSRGYMKYIILKGVTAAEQYPYREMMPFRRNDSSMEITWDVWKFNNHMLGRTPEESVSRMLTMNISQSRESMVRYGIALMLEHGFYKTEKGRLNYRMNMEQITHATATTLAYGAMYQVLHATYKDPNDKYRKKQSRGLQQIAQLFREELANWAIVQKTEKGWSIVYDKCRQKLTERNGKPGNYTVVPQGTRKYIEGRPENNYFVYNGYTGGVNPNPMPHPGSVMRESVGYRTSEHSPNDDPCIRERVIGGFFHVPVPDVSVEDFKMEMMGSEFYTEDKDDYQFAAYKDWVPNFGLFDWDSQNKPLTELGQNYFAVYPKKTWGEYLRSAGIIDKITSKLEKLDPVAQKEFISLVHRNKGGSFAPSAGPIKANQRSTFMSAVGGVLRQLLAAAGEITFNENVMLLAQFKERSLNGNVDAVELNEFALVLDKVDKKLKKKFDNKSLVQILSECCNNPNNNIRNNREGSLSEIDNVIMDMETQLVIADEVLALQDLKQSYGTKLSAIEKIDVNGGTHAASLDEQVKREAAKVSPIWMSFGDEGNPDILPISQPIWTSIHNPIGANLSRATYAFTLATTSLVLFKMSEEELAVHINNKGVICTNSQTLWKNSANADMLNDTVRFSLLQFSVSISAVFELILRAYKKQESGESDVDFENQLIPDILASIPQMHPITKRYENYRTDLHIYVPQLRTLTVQHEMHNCAVFIRDLVLYIQDNRVRNDVQINARVKAAFTDISLIYESQHIRPSYNTKLHNSMGGDGFFGRSILTPAVDKYTDMARSWVVTSEDIAAHNADMKKLNEKAATQTLNILNVMVREEPGKTEKLNQLFEQNGALFTDLFKVLSHLDKEANFELIIRETVKIMMEKQTKRGRLPIQEGLLFLINSIDVDQTDKANFAKTVKAKIPSVEAVKGDLVKKRKAALENIRDRATKLGSSQTLELSTFLTNSDGSNLKTLADLISVLRSRKDLLDKKENFKQALLDPISILLFGDVNFVDCTLGGDKASTLSNIEKLYTEKQFKSYIVWFSGCLLAELIESSAATTNFQTACNNFITVPDLPKHGLNFFKNIVGNKNVASELLAIPIEETTVFVAPEKVPIPEGSILTKAEAENLLDAFEVEDGLFVVFGMDHHLWPFWTPLIFRPHKRYLMGTMIHMNAYGEAGYTYYGWADFQLADNVAQKTHYGHFTMYAKTVVLKPEYIVLAQNIVCKDYIGGNGHLPWNPSNPDHVDAYRSNDLDNDLFVVPAPPLWRATSQFMDTTGRFNDRLMPNAEARKATDYGHIAGLISDIWGWRSIINPVNKDHFQQYSAKFNTMVFQEHQFLYNPMTKKIDIPVMDKGHFGPRVYAGVAAVRRGDEMYMLPVDYDHTRSTVITL